MAKAAGGPALPRIHVVASIAPLAALAARVAGTEAEVATLVPPGASEHTWEPAPRDVQTLARAQVFFKVGMGFESWAGKLLDANAPGCEVVDASRGVAPISESDGHAASSAGSANPHYWLDPLSLEPGVTQLAEVLARLDPGRSSEYRARGRDTCSELRALDAEIRERTARFSSRKLLTFHEAWDYFARRYGFQIVGSIEEFPGKEPGPRHVVEMVRLAQETGVRAVFAEPQSPTKAAEVIAAECGLPMLLLDPLGGDRVPGRSDYFSLMRYNVETMEKALR